MKEWFLFQHFHHGSFHIIVITVHIILYPFVIFSISAVSPPLTISVLVLLAIITREVTSPRGSGLRVVALLKLSEAELLFMYLWPTLCFLQENVYSDPIFKLGYFLLLSCMSSLYILDINPCRVWFANIFFQSVGCHSFCWWFPLLCRSFLVSYSPTCLFFAFIAFVLVSNPKKSLPRPRSRSLPTAYVFF